MRKTQRGPTLALHSVQNPYARLDSRATNADQADRKVARRQFSSSATSALASEKVSRRLSEDLIRPHKRVGGDRKMAACPHFWHKNQSSDRIDAPPTTNFKDTLRNLSGLT